MYEFRCAHCGQQVTSRASNAMFCRSVECQRARKRANRKNSASPVVETVIKPIEVVANVEDQERHLLFIKKIKKQAKVLEQLQERINVLEQQFLKLKHRIDVQEYSYRYDLEVGNR